MDKRVFYANAAIFRVVVGLFLLVILMFVMVFHARAAGTLYAKPVATGTGNCSSWANACALQKALGLAASGDQVWVAAGTHIPTTTDVDPRKATFQLKSGVAIYGGFAGTETVRTERIPATNLTTLSGDNGTLGDSADNSYHVVTGNEVTATAVLDGFTISGGNANGSSPNDSGGGMYSVGGSPTLTNVTFSANSAIYYGAGMTNESSSNPTLTNVIFSGNTASNGGGMLNEISSNPTLTNVTFSGNTADYGGGMVNWTSRPTLTNVTFSGNSASDYGGGMLNDSSNPTLTNVTFFKNTADVGGGMANWSSSPTLTNAIFWGNTPALQIYESGTGSATINYSDIQGVGVHPGIGNIKADPLLTPLANNGGFTQTHALPLGSPAIDAGDPDELNCPPTDQRGYPRPIDGDGNGSAICDMGAFEYGSFTLTVTVMGNGSVAKNPEKAGYIFGEVVTLTATANSDWTFSSWSGDATGTANPLTMNIQGNTNITANFTSIYKLYLPLILKN